MTTLRKRLPTNQEVAVISSGAYDAYIERLEEAGVRFTNRELIEIGVQRQKIRNREASRVSRFRKRERMAFLEERVLELEKESAQLKSELLRFRSLTTTPVKTEMPLEWQPAPFDPYEFLGEMTIDIF